MESLLEAEEQLALLAAQLQGKAVPVSLALLQACSRHSAQHIQREHRRCGCPLHITYDRRQNTAALSLFAAVHGLQSHTGPITRRNVLIAQRKIAQIVQGRVSEWLSSRLGWAAGRMLPSVRCGLEGALLSALAVAQRQPLHALLTACPGDDPAAAGSLPGTRVTSLHRSIGGNELVCGQVYNQDAWLRQHISQLAGPHPLHREMSVSCRGDRAARRRRPQHWCGSECSLA